MPKNHINWTSDSAEENGALVQRGIVQLDYTDAAADLARQLAGYANAGMVLLENLAALSGSLLLECAITRANVLELELAWCRRGKWNQARADLRPLLE